MPQPAYIILANSGAVDQYSNSVSLFDLVECYLVCDRSSIADGKEKGFASKPHRIVVAWLREGADSPTDVFQGQVVCIGPDGEEFFVVNREDFSFDNPICRWNIELLVPGFTMLGTHVVEARLRRAGDEEWTWRQTYSFLVQDPAKNPTPNKESGVTIEDRLAALNALRGESIDPLLEPLTHAIDGLCDSLQQTVDGGMSLSGSLVRLLRLCQKIEEALKKEPQLDRLPAGLVIQLETMLDKVREEIDGLSPGREARE